MKFEVNETYYGEQINIYISVDMNNVNPLEVEKDIEEMKNFLIEKFENKKIEKKSWIEWIKEKLEI